MDPESFRFSLMSGISFSLLVASAMWGVTTIQIISYYRTFKTDSLYLRIAVRSLSIYQWTIVEIVLYRLVSCGEKCVFRGWPTLNAWKRVCETLFIALNAATLYDLMFRSSPFLTIPLTMYVGSMFASIMRSIVQVSLSNWAINYKGWRYHEIRLFMPFESTKYGTKSGYLCYAAQVLSTALGLVSRGISFWSARVWRRSYRCHKCITGLCVLGSQGLQWLTSSSLSPCATFFEGTATI